MDILKAAAKSAFLPHAICAIVTVGVALVIVALVSIDWLVITYVNVVKVVTSIGLWRFCALSYYTDDPEIYCDVNSDPGLHEVRRLTITTAVFGVMGLAASVAFMAHVQSRKISVGFLLAGCVGASINAVVCIGLMGAALQSEVLQGLMAIADVKLGWAYPVMCSCAGAFLVSVVASCLYFLNPTSTSPTHPTTEAV